MMEIFKNPRYRGKHVVLAAGHIYTAKTGQGASEILEKIRSKYPKVMPEIVYLPKDSLTVYPSLFFRADQSLSCF